MEVNIPEINEIARQAGIEIMKIYNDPAQDFQTELKTDSSPLTIADRVSHDVIVGKLKESYPGVPIISEEGKDVPYELRKDWAYFWCVDPLDGTKEFLKRNGEFTVNIALIHHGHPVLGVIYVPASGILYYGSTQTGSCKQTPDGTVAALRVITPATNWISVGSRSHASAEEEQLLARYPVCSSMSIGSSLKFCMIAEGKAHIYYRHGPTMEWDTAAGQAIATYAGAIMTTPEGQPFTYNKASLLNGSFVCRVD